MAGILICLPNPSFTFRRIIGVRCCAGATNNQNRRSGIEIKAKTPQILKLAICGITELLRAFSFSSDSSGTVTCGDRDEICVSSVDDVMMILKTDYENAYFVTGFITSSIYVDDCLFEDPTIRFRGTELYLRNLKLLVPFFESPSIGLQNIEKGVDSGTNILLATWKLRTYLKFPWKPFISIDGSTTYELNKEFKVIRHAESWNVSALEAVGQIFTPSFGRPGDGN